MNPAPAAPTILIVDDDRDGTFFTERMLRKHLGPCFLLTAAGVDAALPLLRKARIDAIVTDHHLGPRTGCDFVAEARYLGIACPILLVTASDNPHVAAEAYGAGATKVFPAGREDFALFLQQLLQGGKALPVRLLVPDAS